MYRWALPPWEVFTALPAQLSSRLSVFLAFLLVVSELLLLTSAGTELTPVCGWVSVFLTR